MINKLIYRVPSGGNGLRNILPSKKPIQNRIIGGMYFDTGSNDEGQPLLLPDESCLAEDERGVFKLQCEREGFHLFKWGGVNLFNVHAKIYLTNYRLIFVPLDEENHRYKSISICVEAIRNPQIEPYKFSVPDHLLEFDVCLDHGTSTAQRHADSCKTVGELFGQRRHETSSDLPAYRSCRIACSFHRSARAKMFLKGIKILIAEGKVCPTKHCRFIEYEDLPLYYPATPEPPAFDDFSVHKLPVY